MKIFIPRRRYGLMRACLLLPPLCVLASVLACSGPKPEPQAGAVVETNADPNLITMQNPGQFQLTAPELHKVSDEIRVTGVISPDVNKSVPILSLGGGRVAAMKVKLGDYVTKGETLLYIESPDFAAAISDYAKFKADRALATKQMARAQLLYDKGAISLAELETAQDADTKSQADLKAALQRVQVMGGDVDNPSPLLPVRAPISGTIVDQQTTGGTGVRSLDNQVALLTIADLSTVWALCDVYQDLLPNVHVGDTANIAVSGYPGEDYPGKVINISEVLDPTTRSAKVRIELPNPHRILRAGMFITATFHSHTPADRLFVPATAVVHLHDKDWVFVAAGETSFAAWPCS